MSQLDKVELQKLLNELAREVQRSSCAARQILPQKHPSRGPGARLSFEKPDQQTGITANEAGCDYTLTAERFRLVVAELKSPYGLMVIIAVVCAFEEDYRDTFRVAIFLIASRLFLSRPTEWLDCA